jgi:AbrB family looped-hinge helix DNA binding protein
MSKVTSKLQITIPKALAERYGIHPGDEIDFEPLARFSGSFPRVPGRHASAAKSACGSSTRPQPDSGLGRPGK